MEIQNKIQYVQILHKFHIYKFAVVLNFLSDGISVSDMSSRELPINIFS